MRAPHGTTKSIPRSMCQYPECKYMATTEIAAGVHREFIHLCSPHARLVRDLSFEAYSKLKFQHKWKRTVNEAGTI